MEINYIGSDETVSDAIEREYYLNSIRSTMVTLFSDTKIIKKELASLIKDAISSYIQDNLSDIDKTDIQHAAYQEILVYMNDTLSTMGADFWVYCMETLGNDFCCKVSYESSYYKHAREYGFAGRNKVHEYTQIIVESMQNILEEKATEYLSIQATTKHIPHDIKEIDIGFN